MKFLWYRLVVAKFNSAVLVSINKTKKHVRRFFSIDVGLGGYFSYELELKQPMKERSQDQPSITDIVHINGVDKRLLQYLTILNIYPIEISGDGLLELIPDIYSAYPLSGKLFWE